MLQDFDGHWRSGQQRLNITTNRSFTILYGKTYTWNEVSTINNTVHTWTGPGCMYSVTDIPVSIQRALGYSTYTIINLGWFDIFYLQACGYYPNQKRLIEYDLRNFSYYKPISVTCKLIPKYPRAASKISGYFPSAADLQIYQPPAITTGVQEPAGATVTNPNLAVTPQLSKLQITSTSYDSIWDDDSRNLVAYLIPLNGQGIPRNLDLDPRVIVANSIFSSVERVPTNDFISSFRKAGYSRTTVSRSRPTRFVYKFTRNNISERLHIPDDSFYSRPASGSIPAIPRGMIPNRFWETIRWGNVTNGYSMFSRDDQILESLKKNWIPADIRTIPIYRSGTVLGNQINDLGDYVESSMMDLMPIDSCSVFIPGIDTNALMTMFNVQFSFTCSYLGRTYDMV